MTLPRNFEARRIARRTAAKDRAALRAMRSPQQQLALLNALGERAIKERARLAVLIAADESK